MGVAAAHIIASELEIKNFDEKNLKGLCPLHQESTPSFVWNPKSNSYHCFGCGRNIDIIDMYMLKGLSFAQSVEELFKLVGMQGLFGERGIKERRGYRYPVDIANTQKDKVYTYLGKRKISKETVDYVGIGQDQYGNIVFRYFDLNDNLTMVKYRPSRAIKKGETKCWFQKEADTCALLYNMNKIDINKPLLICCGECDCLAAIQSGFLNSVSIPMGDQNTQWIQENWTWLEKFEKIILCPDNDDSGKKFKEEVVYRLGSWRCSVVSIPEKYIDASGVVHRIKDLNELLFYLGEDKVMAAIADAKDSPIESIVDFSDIHEIDLDEIGGLYTGISQVDMSIMRMFYGTYNVLSGVNGSGKSSFLSQLICQALEQNVSSWLYSKELPNFMSKSWINSILAGNRHIKPFMDSHGAVYYKVNAKTSKAINDYYKEKIFIYKDGWSNFVEDIKISMEASARKYGSKLFILDNLTTIGFNTSDTDKWGAQVKFVNYLIDFAQKFNVVVVLVVHPKKLDRMRRMEKFDVGGLGDIINLAHRLITLYRVTPNDKRMAKNNPEKGYGLFKYDVILDILKDRMTGKENSSVGLYYDPPSRRFYTNPDEYEHNYKWDTEIYADHLIYPHDDETEIFGKVEVE